MGLSPHQAGGSLPCLTADFAIICARNRSCQPVLIHRPWNEVGLNFARQGPSHGADGSATTMVSMVVSTTTFFAIESCEGVSSGESTVPAGRAGLENGIGVGRSARFKTRESAVSCMGTPSGRHGQIAAVTSPDSRRFRPHIGQVQRRRTSKSSLSPGPRIEMSTFSKGSPVRTSPSSRHRRFCKSLRRSW